MTTHRPTYRVTLHVDTDGLGVPLAVWIETLEAEYSTPSDGSPWRLRSSRGFLPLSELPGQLGADLGALCADEIPLTLFEPAADEAPF